MATLFGYFGRGPTNASSKSSPSVPDSCGASSDTPDKPQRKKNSNSDSCESQTIKKTSKKRKSGDQDESKDGKDETTNMTEAKAKMQAKRRQILEQCDPETEKSIRACIYEMEEVSEEEKATFGAVFVGYVKFMEENNLKPASITSYKAAIHRLFMLQLRSCLVMASEEYCIQVKRTYADKKSNHLISCGLRWFGRFYSACCEKNGGKFILDPSWEETAAKSSFCAEPIYDKHGELRQGSKARASKYVGVLFHKTSGKWIAISKEDHKCIGFYLTQERAAEARRGSVHVQAPGKSVLDLLGGTKSIESGAPTDNANAAPAKPVPDASDDGDISMTMNIVPIIDPILRMRIETPVRGKNCEHVGVFDKEAYLEFNAMQEKRKFNRLKDLWLCPICNMPTPERSLVLVEAFVEVLAAAKHKPDIEHVAALPDGTFSLLD